MRYTDDSEFIQKETISKAGVWFIMSVPTFLPLLILAIIGFIFKLKITQPALYFYVGLAVFHLLFIFRKVVYNGYIDSFPTVFPRMSNFCSQAITYLSAIACVRVLYVLIFRRDEIWTSLNLSAMLISLFFLSAVIHARAREADQIRYYGSGWRDI